MLSAGAYCEVCRVVLGRKNRQPPPRGSEDPVTGAVKRCRRRPTLPRALARSTIGAIRLNDRVRDGNGCGPDALVASEFCTPVSA